MINNDIPQIIYIAGTARSGTTILAMLLGSCEGVLNVGEITHIYDDGVIQNKQCTCGESAKKCPVWSSVLRELQPRINLDSIFTSFDRHMGLPRALWEYLFNKDNKSWIDVNKSILQGLNKSSSTNTIVDSSKYAARGILMCNNFAVETKVICITRSPKGILKAFSKKNEKEQLKKTPRQACAYYFITAMSLRILSFCSRKKHIWITYEELLENPIDVLHKIEGFLNTDLTQAKRLVENSLPLSTGHVITGNRLRHRKTVVFQNSGNTVVPEQRVNYFYLMVMSSLRILLLIPLGVKPPQR